MLARVLPALFFCCFLRYPEYDDGRRERRGGPNFPL